VLKHLGLVRVHHILMSFLGPPLRRREVKRGNDSSESFLTLRKLRSTRLQRLVLRDSKPLSVKAALPVVRKIIVVRLRAFSIHGFGVISLLDVNLVLESSLAVAPSVIQIGFVALRDRVKVPAVVNVVDVVSFDLLFLVLLDLIFDG
jgi:hypothetical protein